MIDTKRRMKKEVIGNKEKKSVMIVIGKARKSGIMESGMMIDLTKDDLN
jgi:hypothetical protein